MENNIIKKKIRGLNMLTALMLLLVTALSSLAQDTIKEVEMDIITPLKTPRTIPGIKTEGRGNHETYIISHQGDYLVVYNKKDTLIQTYSTFLVYREIAPEANRSIGIDKPLLNSYVEKFLSPHFGGNSIKYADMEYVGISLFADLDGNIKEISMGYNKEIKLPFTAIEAFERAVLNGELKLVFDKNRWFFKDATYVVMTYEFRAEELRKQGIKK